VSEGGRETLGGSAVGPGSFFAGGSGFFGTAATTEELGGSAAPGSGGPGLESREELGELPTPRGFRLFRCVTSSRSRGGVSDVVFPEPRLRRVDVPKSTRGKNFFNFSPRFSLDVGLLEEREKEREGGRVSRRV